MQMPTRYKKFGIKPPQQGLMLMARLELLDEKLTADNSTLKAVPAGSGETKVTSFQLGANYWLSKRFRTSFNWTLNQFSGTTSYIATGALKNAKDEQEFSFRLAIAL